MYKNLYDNHEFINYIGNKKNIGFGAGHNKIVNLISNTSELHLILNPDVFFDKNTINSLAEKLLSEKSLAMIAPRVKFPNGNEQYTVRKYPSFLDLFLRKIGIGTQRIYAQEYRDLDLSEPFYPEAIHGCFMLFKTEDFIALDGFDERYFLYMEDIDICKKIDALGKKKLYYPEVEITHVLKKGSSKNIILFYHHLSSAIRYFLKWK
ncbi:glycosyltransferase family protein [Tenacibaculum agarivorans]|uniref:glycosyl transferase family 2 n=1 Tax=Tenacibaculum agarivorans TaxID=1908389 RepID=UPI000AE02488